MNFNKKNFKSRIYSTSRNLRKNADIEEWIQTVDDAHLFNGFINNHGFRERSESDALCRLMRDQDVAYSEAQELLQEWMTEKLLIDSLDCEDNNYDIGVGKSRDVISEEWRNMLQDNGIWDSSKKKSFLNNSIDDKEAVEKVINDLLKTECPISHLSSQDSRKSTVDPQVKMQLRQENVKKNRLLQEEKRKKMAEEQILKKEALHAARKTIQKEQQRHEQEQKREELLIQQEMVKIRKKFQEKNKMNSDKLQKDTDNSKNTEGLKVSNDSCIKDGLNMKQPNPSGCRSTSTTVLTKTVRNNDQKTSKPAPSCSYAGRSIDQSHRPNLDTVHLTSNHMEKSEFSKQNSYTVMIIEQFIKKRTNKILRQVFGSWNKAVVSRRIKMAKMAAISDWKVKTRALLAWRDCCRRLQIERKIYHEEMHAQNMEKKLHLAKNKYHKSLLRKYLNIWLLWWKSTVSLKSYKEQQEGTHSKMVAFLLAAEQKVLEEQKIEKEQNPPSNLPQEELDKESSQIVKHAWGMKVSDVLPNKQQVELSKKMSQQSEIYDISTNTLLNPDECTKKFLSSNKHKNLFHNRHVAQQKLLKEQKTLIDEQQRMIQELQYYQNQQVLQKQAEEYEILRLNLDKPSSQSVPAAAPTTGYQNSNTLSPSVKLQNKDVSYKNPPSSKRRNKFLEGMQQRAQEREKSKIEREERRKKEEEIKLMQLKSEQEEMERRSLQEKKAQRKLYLEKKLLEEEKQAAKLKEEEQMKLMNHKADDLYRRCSLKYRGLRPWLRFIQNKHHKMDLAIDFYNKIILRHILRNWHRTTSVEVLEKNYIADSKYHYLLIKHSFLSWTQYKNYLNIQEMRACDHYNHYLTHRVFVSWQQYLDSERIIMRHNELTASHQNITRIIKVCFSAWRKYPGLLRQEVETEKRRSEMRKKVASLLPDFIIHEGENK